ncbi:MAG: rhodanese-like protein [Burkholderiaceae bacterium]|nr:rhodanese-like protein [Burkholderiaceae bacterium]
MQKILLALLLLLVTWPGHAQTDFCRQAKQSVLIDVRTPEEYATGHIAGALNLPLERLAAGIGTIGGLNSDSLILVYCRTGNRSAQTRALLSRRGYANVTDGGGISTLASRLQACSESR